MADKLCKVCKTKDNIVALKAGKVFIGFFCRHHIDMIKVAARLGTTIAGVAMRTYLKRYFPNAVSAFEIAVRAITVPQGQAPIEDLESVENVVGAR